MIDIDHRGKVKNHWNKELMNTNNIVRTNVLIVDDIIIDGVIIMALV
jgi:hypothetical protein